jgi:hypothetical protein
MPRLRENIRIKCDCHYLLVVNYYLFVLSPKAVIFIFKSDYFIGRSDYQFKNKHLNQGTTN